MSVLDDMDLSIDNCRWQAFDNASNMSGIYAGLQAKIKQEMLQQNTYRVAGILSTLWDAEQLNAALGQ